jgi:hypothetical protein
MIIVFVVVLLVVIDFAKFGGHYARTISDTTQQYLTKVLH